MIPSPVPVSQCKPHRVLVLAPDRMPNPFNISNCGRCDEEETEELIKTATFLDNSICNELTCAICMGVVRKAVRGCSGDHFFCSSCLSRHFEEAQEDEEGVVEFKCPTCREPAQAGLDRKPGARAQFVDYVVDNALIMCPHGCEKHFKIKDTAAHSDACPEKMVGCPFEKHGCTTTVKRKDLQAHVEANATQHMFMYMHSNEDETAELTYSVSAAKRLVRSSYKKLSDYACTNFQAMQTNHDIMSAQISALTQQVSSMSKALEFLVSANVQFAPNVASRGKASIDVAGIKRKAEEVKKGLAVFNAAPSTTPPAKKPKDSPVAPGAPGPSAFSSAYRTIDPPPLLERDMFAESGTTSPQYSPTSPSYSPTSPAYSPTSPRYNNPVAGNSADDLQVEGA